MSLDFAYDTKNVLEYILFREGKNDVFSQVLFRLIRHLNEHDKQQLKKIIDNCKLHKYTKETIINGINILFEDKKYNFIKYIMLIDFISLIADNLDYITRREIADYILDNIMIYTKFAFNESYEFARINKLIKQSKENRDTVNTLTIVAPI